MDWNYLWNYLSGVGPEWGQIALRLACAMLVGIVIGLEREYTHRPAGLRTHILVALGACVVSVTGEILFTHYASLGATPDPARLSAQVITGVGFLGAGTIMKEGVNVKGLTTAASVWAVACLGIAAGFGYYALTILGMLFVMVTLTVVEALQHRFINTSGSQEHYVVETEDISQLLNQLQILSQAQKVLIMDMSAQQTQWGYQLSFRAIFSGRRHKRHHSQFFAALMEIPGVRSATNGAEAKA